VKKTAVEISLARLRSLCSFFLSFSFLIIFCFISFRCYCWPCLCVYGCVMLLQFCGCSAFLRWWCWFCVGTVLLFERLILVQWCCCWVRDCDSVM
jgi:hypothetical protein